MRGWALLSSFGGPFVCELVGGWRVWMERFALVGGGGGGDLVVVLVVDGGRDSWSQQNMQCR